MRCIPWCDESITWSLLKWWDTNDILQLETAVDLDCGNYYLKGIPSMWG